MMKNWLRGAHTALLVSAGAAFGVAQAAVPPDIEAQLLKIGQIVDPPCTAKLYRPLMPVNDITSGVTPLYPGIKVVRDISFGPNPKDVVDVFTAEKGPESRTVLIYVPGGAGDKIELQNKESNAFYDNIMRWATKHGMVGVNMQRHFSPTWDAGARDVSHMIQWVQANIAQYHGNPERIFIWAHSAGNMPLGTYVGHPELYGPKGLGVKGIIFMSPANFNILPLAPPAPSMQDMMHMFSLAGKTCGASGPGGTAGALPGKGMNQPGGPTNEPLFGPPPGPNGPPVVDDATKLQRSSLPELKKTSAKILLANGEFDIGSPDPKHGGLTAFSSALHDELCQEGPQHCPSVLVGKGHSHMSMVFAIDTDDTSVSDPILKWIHSVP
jgi:triacylglycerol lipase